VTTPRIPGYQYVEHLGSGGFADVFLYEQEWPRQRVAIKVVRPDVPLNEREKSLFTSEANAMARLADHPYIVSVMTAGVTEEGRPFLVMRYCPPPDLGVRVRSNPMPVAEAIATGIKLASAIETAHRSGILHRDIKPSNVLVTTYSEPALTDFGIAGGMHEVEGDRQELRISYPWSPPEILDGRSNGSVASDVYSLGATIWHLLVGRSPFSIPSGDNSTRALTARILHAEPPATHRPDAPPALERLLQQCLAKDPSHRPASALELARELQRIEASAGFARTPIAVEGAVLGRHADQRGDNPGYSEDATRLKAPTLMTGAEPRASSGEQPPEPPRTPREMGALFIADEMITGFGRTGRPWGVDHSGARPDIVTLGKGFGSGFPVSGVLTRTDIAQAKPWSNPSGASSSYGGNALASAAALASVRTIREDRLWENAERVGAAMLAELRRFQERHAFVGDVRGAGLFLGIELVKDRRTKEPLDAAVMKQVYQDCLQRGLLAMSYTPHVRLQPALTIDRETALEGLGILGEVFRELDASGRWR